jgi:mRNA interferase HigB
MIVVGKRLLVQFADVHPDVRGAVAAWLGEAEEAHWRAPQDIKDRYRSASFIGKDRVVFNLRGNNYRLDIQVNYASQVVLIRRIGTHAEYDKWTF